MARKRRKPRPRRPPPPKPAGEAAPPRAKPAPSQRRGRAVDDRPPAPWGSFPLVEIVVLVALVMLVVGFFTRGEQGTTLLVTGFALGSLAGLELSIREHFTGYRSHTVLLAGALAVVVMLGAYYLGDLAPAVCIALGAGAGVAAAWLLVSVFRKRSGQIVKLR